MNNSAYLKDYVRMHPDNRMAWYLLGKEYEQNGQEGKANYCYIQAGDIYEAFESSKTPDEVWKEYAAELLEASKRKEKIRMRWRKGLAAAMLLLLILLSPLWTIAPSSGKDVAGQPEGATEPAAAAGSPAGHEAGRPAGQSLPKGPVFTAAAAGTEAERAAALAALLEHPGGANGSLLALLGMRSQGDWLLWSREMPLEYSVVQDADSGRSSVQSLNPATCACKPPEEPALKRQAEEWTGEQELLALLSTAMLEFKQAHGRYPDKPSELNQPYPNNWIAGDTPGLGQAFQTALAKLKQPQGLEGAASGSQAGQADGHAAGEPGGVFFGQPLEIKIDKTKHLLALTSGNVILRVYQAGLGGERTPEGVFQITEKVINPNGHDNGEFGSRGMALSAGNYAIHGTNESDSIGKDESLGCIRLAKADVEELFDMVPKGIQVTVGKGILPELKPGENKPRFLFPDRQDQTNPHKTYHWLD
ncbi:hypothetical protein AWM70_04090 [Paenibacillus yonginensis]|uniref:L,D-TPase catalytic domain-containing protein n=1 Tax=Paenibacillus yonginensis TaxID=1462996 RepID=A0A1B1MXD8_9BACL|nr:L,D-transpeptidase [Paenibacillus yonginensis]ANS73852.1 hypothetical protein AWM70_04090 [Paenibacillus yonginensis]